MCFAGFQNGFFPDYTFAIDALKIGEEVKVVVQRDGKSVELKVTPRSRQ